MQKEKKLSEPISGFSFDSKFCSINLRIFKTFEKDGRKWKPRKPDFDKLRNKWIIVVPHVLSLSDPVLCLIDDDEDEIFTSDGVPLKAVIDPSTMRFRESMTLYPEKMWKIHVLDPPEVSSARKVIKDIESENLQKSLESNIATYAHTILKLKKEVEDARIAELINLLDGKIGEIEESTDEAAILGEKLAGRPSKKREELEEFVQKHQSVKNYVDALEKQENKISEMSIQQIIDDVRMRHQDEPGDDILERYYDWIMILYDISDDKMDEIIRTLYFDLEMSK